MNQPDFLDEIIKADNCSKIEDLPLRIAHVRYSLDYSENNHEPIYASKSRPHLWEVLMFDSLTHLEARYDGFSPHVVVTHWHGNKNDGYSETHPKMLGKMIRDERMITGDAFPIVIATYYRDSFLRDVLYNQRMVLRSRIDEDGCLRQMIKERFEGYFDIMFSMREFYYSTPLKNICLAIWLFFHREELNSMAEYKEFDLKCGHVLGGVGKEF